MTLEPKKIKSVIASTFSPSICHEDLGPDAMILLLLLFFNTEFQATFVILSPSSKVSLVNLHFLPLKWYHFHV